MCSALLPPFDLPLKKQFEIKFEIVKKIYKIREESKSVSKAEL